MKKIMLHHIPSGKGNSDRCDQFVVNIDIKLCISAFNFLSNLTQVVR